MTIRLAFFGTPAVAVPAFETLLADQDIEIVAVVTNPDRPKGRSKSLIAPPVKVAATEAGIPVLQPNKPAEIIDELTSLNVDAVAIVAYGAILPAAVLAAGGRGFVNLHFSLLPRWRGAAPVQAAIRAGDATTGVTCFILDEGMDTGPILRVTEVAIGEDETAGDLLERLAVVGGPVLLDAIKGLFGGETGTTQPHDGATIAGKIRPADVALDFTQPAAELGRLVRSANPAPGAHTTFRGKRLKVWRAQPLGENGMAMDLATDAAPGAFVGTHDAMAVVQTGLGLLVLGEVQPEGKARMDGVAFANGYQPTSDESLRA